MVKAPSCFPALKALGEGLTGQVYYLTARTTQRQGALEALRRMRGQPLHLWALTLDAKDKQCPEKTLCHPDWCPRARGHFLRDSAGGNAWGGRLVARGHPPHGGQALPVPL